MNHLKRSFCHACFLILIPAIAMADPCGMVPPIYTGPGTAIKRVGLQQTYVFYDQGIESFVIRPGFQGKIDNFGMLIPFPNPPAIRKVADNTFAQIANAVDPPEIVVDLRWEGKDMDAFANFAQQGQKLQVLQSKEEADKVKVLREEAVGMYEVAVLQAGSAKALKKWMDEHKFQYPNGMDRVTNDYVEEGWCFVAVKTKVGDKKSANPRPGGRRAKPQLPAGSIFDGHVQGLGFRFRSDKLVVPMRLSAFNEGDMRNIVYLLTRGSKRIKGIPEEYVVRQVPGKQIAKNITQPLPLRIIGGNVKDIPKWRRDTLKSERDPTPYNAIAKQLFAADIVAAKELRQDGLDLSLEHEEAEKEFLRINEHFGIRGPNADAEVADAANRASQQYLKFGIRELRNGDHPYFLTIVDGDFPRQVVASQNLTFERYKMLERRNSTEFYDAKINQPSGRKIGTLITASDPWSNLELDGVSNHQIVASSQTASESWSTSRTSLLGLLWIGLVLTGVFYINFRIKLPNDTDGTVE